MNKGFMPIWFLALVIISFVSGVVVAHAASFDLPNLQCPTGIDCSSVPPTIDGPGSYIARFYQIAIAIAGIIAVLLIVTGSLYFTFAGGSSDRQKEGKDMITAALWGILLLFGSYLILNTINPELINLSEPDVKGIRVSSSTLHIGGENTQAAACAPWRIAGNSAPCDPESPTYNSCSSQVNLTYTLKMEDCREKYKDVGGGSYIFATDKNVVPRCHPYYKNFETREIYNPQKDNSNVTTWYGWPGKWDFCILR